MHENPSITLKARHTGTGVMVEAFIGNERVIAHVEIGRDLMMEWVADHADRASAVKFDKAIDRACTRTAPNPNGNLTGILDSITSLISLQAQNIA